MKEEMDRNEEHLRNAIWTFEEFISVINNFPLHFIDYDGEFSKTLQRASYSIENSHSSFANLKQSHPQLWARLQAVCGNFLTRDETRKIDGKELLSLHGRDLYEAYLFLRQHGAQNTDLNR